MIKYIKQNVCDTTSGIIAHGVNCQGVMGSGVALALKTKWPQVYKNYMQKFESIEEGPDLLGEFDLVEISPTLFVANCFTQIHYGKDGKVYANSMAIYSSMYKVMTMAHEKKLPVYMPKIGCGLGGLDWETQVKSEIEYLDQKFPEIKLYVCDL